MSNVANNPDALRSLISDLGGTVVSGNRFTIPVSKLRDAHNALAGVGMKANAISEAVGRTCIGKVQSYALVEVSHPEQTKPTLIRRRG